MIWKNNLKQKLHEFQKCIRLEEWARSLLNSKWLSRFRKQQQVCPWRRNANDLSVSTLYISLCKFPYFVLFEFLKNSNLKEFRFEKSFWPYILLYCIPFHFFLSHKHFFTTFCPTYSLLSYPCVSDYLSCMALHFKAGF